MSSIDIRLICNTVRWVYFNCVFENFKTFVRLNSNIRKKFNPFRKRNPGFTDEAEQSKIASRVCLTVLGNGAIGQPKCLAVFTNQKNYLFNCGEGIGRLCRELDISLVSVRDIFITQKTWRNLSGVPDVYLTNNSLGVQKIYLHGPPGIERFVQLVTSLQKDIIIKSYQHFFLPYVDDTLEVHCVPIQQSSGCNIKFKDISRIERNKGNTQTAEMNSNFSVSYICRVKKKPGEFMPEKCVEYNVPIGPLLLKLKNGEDVTLPSGKLVHSCDVHNEAYPESVFLVVDCPSSHLLKNFVSEAKFFSYQLPQKEAMSVAAVVHFSPPLVVRSPLYQEWMKKFHPDVYHIILNSDNPTASSAVIHEMQNFLHLLHPRIFSLIQERKNESTWKNDDLLNVLQAPNHQQLHLRPIKRLDCSNVIKDVSEEFIASIKDKLNINENVKELYKIVKEHHSDKIVDIYPEVLFLGTGSSTSSPHRNVSGILVNTSTSSSILLDCGEGTFKQLVRSCGWNNVDSVLKKIAAIFVSHKHTDHYMGLFELVKARKEAFRRSFHPYTPVVLVLPILIEKVVMHFHEIFEPIKEDVEIFPCHTLTNERALHNLELKERLNNIELTTVPVRHCVDSHGVVLQEEGRWKLVYSGDAAPTQRLVEQGLDCTLLIHETSIEDDLVNEASMKYHSTPAQVLDISRRMRAQHTILTHFSKRYLAAPVLPEGARLGCSFDFMRVRLCDLPLLPHFVPILQDYFSELLEEHSEKSANVVSFENVFSRVLRSQV